MRKNYSEKEWKLISELPQLTGLLMSSAIYSGIQGAKQELNTSLKSIADGLIKFPDNEFISALLPNVISKSELMLMLKQQQDKIIESIGVLDEKTTHFFQQNTLEQYEKVMHFIAKKQTYLSVVEFKFWLLYIAEQVVISSIQISESKEDSDSHSKEKHLLFKEIKSRLDKSIVS